MSNLRSDCRDLVKGREPGDVWRAHIERLCLQIDELEERWHKANQRIKAIRDMIGEIVVTDGIDKGVILKSSDSPTRYDPERKVQVYLRENFSELGDSLIALHEFCVID